MGTAESSRGRSKLKSHWLSHSKGCKICAILWGSSEQQQCRTQGPLWDLSPHAQPKYWVTSREAICPIIIGFARRAPNIVYHFCSLWCDPAGVQTRTKMIHVHETIVPVPCLLLTHAGPVWVGSKFATRDRCYRTWPDHWNTGCTNTETTPTPPRLRRSFWLWVHTWHWCRWETTCSRVSSGAQKQLPGSSTKFRPRRFPTGLRTPGDGWKTQWDSQTWAGRWGSNCTTIISRETQSAWACAVMTQTRTVWAPNQDFSQTSRLPAFPLLFYFCTV